MPEKSAPPEFREVFARHWRRYHAAHGARVPRTHVRAAQAILDCHTAALGGSLYACADCGQKHYAHHSCNHRNCPGCGYGDALQWAEQQQQKLLPGIPYSLVTFTIPEPLRRTFRSNQELCYRLLFKASAAALQEVAAIEQTPRRPARHDRRAPHLDPPDGIPPAHPLHRRPGRPHPRRRLGTIQRPKILPAQSDQLSARTRTILRKALEKEDPRLYKTIPTGEWYKGWNVHISAAGNGTHAVEYLSRYVNQTALSRKRILADDGEHVTPIA